MREIDCAGSSNIQRITYDENTAVLEIEFIKDGSIYNYPDVPGHVVDALEAAESKGSFANKNIYKQYPGTRIR